MPIHYPESERLLPLARKVTPLGTQTRSKGAQAFVEGAWPAFINRGQGAWVWDVDGNKFCDWMCALGPVTLGYCYPSVDEAVRRQLNKGTIFSLPSPLEAECADALLAMLGLPEQARFIKTGSESTEAAIRIARKATWRDKIFTIRTGYHSWHSWFQASKPDHPGVPRSYGSLLELFSYNNLEELERIFALAESGVLTGGLPAAVIMEPTLIEPPKPRFLEGVRKLCDDYGVLLIFDEVVCGFRWAIGGGGEYFGVRPDLACFGKGMANGMPLACVVGPERLIKHADVVSGTFGGECLSLAACLEVLKIYRQQPVIEHLWKTGNELMYRLNAAFTHSGFGDGSQVRARCIGYGVHPKIVWEGEQADLAAAVFWQECAANGVLFHPSGFNVSYSHGPAELEFTSNAVAAALQYMGGPLHDGDFARALKGKPPAANPFRPA